MFSRKKSSDVESAIDPVAAAAEVEQPGGKGRPTPKRKDAEAANKRPLVPDDRRAAAKAARAKQREARDLEYQAMKSGDEKHLPPRDRGPLRRYIRDYIDARRNIAEYFLFVAAAFLVLTFVPKAALVAILGVYLVVIVAIIDSAIMWRMLKKRLVTKFGADAVVRGTAMYAIMRAFQIRRARLPKAMVKHGDFPA